MENLIKSILILNHLKIRLSLNKNLRNKNTYDIIIFV